MTPQVWQKTIFGAFSEKIIALLRVLVPDLLSYKDAVRYSALQGLEVQGHRQEHLTQTFFECL